LKESLFLHNDESYGVGHTKLCIYVFSFGGKKIISIFCLLFDGQVAQLVEQRTENPCVGGSIPSLSTSVNSSIADTASAATIHLFLFFPALLITGYSMSWKALYNASGFEHYLLPK
jgi:hypothetical protein